MAALSILVLSSAAVAQSNGYVVVHHFNFGVDGTPPSALIQAGDGNLWGTTYAGTTFLNGGIFLMTLDGTTTVGKVFGEGAADGAHPLAALLQGSDGALYGTTTNGGSYEAGVIFKGGGTFHTFNGLDGRSPWAPLIQASDGKFYGTTTGGGGIGTVGSVFRMDPSGAVTVIHAFVGSDGSNPQAAVVQASDGMLYGTTKSGGVGNDGTVFRMNLDGSNFATLVQFGQIQIAGIQPIAPLIQASNGDFYGTTSLDFPSSSFHSTVFRMTADGTVTVPHTFVYSEGGAFNAPLLQASDGNLYGTASGGGQGSGTVFRMSLDGAQVIVLHAFTNNPDGVSPTTGLVQTVDGRIYGTTSKGGSNGYGVAFRLERPFTDDPIVSGTTPINAVHITELRAAVDALTSEYGFPPWSGYTNTTLTPNVTAIAAVDILETRDAMARAYAIVGAPTPTYSTTPGPGVPITAADINELRAALRAIE